MSEDDVLFGYRLRLFTLAAEIGVRAACRAMGVHHSTYYRWKEKVDRWGLEALRIRERRRPRMPNQIGPHIEQRVLASPWPIPAAGQGASRPNLHGRSGAGFGSPSTASGASSVATGFRRARSAWR
jgi:Winged helix-turn helix